MFYLCKKAASNKTLPFPHSRESMSTRRAAGKTASWKDFLYSDPEGFVVQGVKFANGTTGRGLFVNRKFEAHEFLLSYWGPRRSTQVANFNYVWKFRREKEFSSTPQTRLILAWRGSSTTRTDQSPQTVEWKRSMTIRADHIASSSQLVLFSQVSLIFQSHSINVESFF